MQTEQDWIGRIDSDPGGAAERYQYFMRPEPRENLGPIVEIEDEYLGKVKTRQMRIGMIRNAKDENKKDVLVYLSPFPHIRIDNAKPLQGWYQSKHNPSKRSRPRPCFTDAILTEPYGGYCAVGCAFCYINSGVKGYRGSGLITVPLDYGEQIKKQLSKMNRSAAGYFSSFTDPFTPLENYYHNTERAAEEFVKVGLPIFFLSRLAYPQWAIDLLKQNPHSYAQKSINTCDPDDWRLLSPGALSLEDHLQEIAKLHDEGIYVSIQVNPIIAGVTSHAQICKLFKMLRDAGADHVIVKFVEAAYSWAPDMVNRIKRRFGEERGSKFEKLFTQNIGSERTVEEEYRMAGHKVYQKMATKLGLTYATCYEYEYERDANGKILSKTGISVGRRFTTADQCHGHKVPMYYRDNEVFKPLDECPPSGCLYCADENGGEPRCGDALAGEAKALRLVDLKVPFHLKSK